MIKINFRDTTFKFKKGEFTDLDCWYSEQLTEIEEDYKDNCINKKEVVKLCKTLLKLVDYIYKKI